VSIKDSDIEVKEVIERAIEIGGGREIVNAKVTADYQATNDLWNQEHNTIGRILRSHLFVEHFMNQVLLKKFLNVNNLKECRLSFAQKLALLKGYSNIIELIHPGLKSLNKSRNQISHNLQYKLSREDIKSFTSIKVFQAVRIALAAPGKPSDEPIEILESFAKFAGSCLHESFTDDSLGSGSLKQLLS